MHNLARLDLRLRQESDALQEPLALNQIVPGAPEPHYCPRTYEGKCDNCDKSTVAVKVAVEVAVKVSESIDNASSFFSH